MRGTQAFILLVTIAALLTISIMWKDWLAAKEHEHWQDAALKLSQQEMERIRMITTHLSSHCGACARFHSHAVYLLASDQVG